MNKYGLNFLHLGLAVTYQDKAVIFLKGIGYHIGESIFDAMQNVNLVFCIHDTMPDIELIYRAASPGPLDTILKENTENIYHICYTCADLGQTLNKIKLENRVITISEPKPAVLFDNKKVSFYKVAGLGIIEILEV